MDTKINIDCRNLLTKVSSQKLKLNIFEHTNHSTIRSAQRGINQQKISAVLKYGKSFHRQGLIFYVLGDNNIPDILLKERNRYKNTIVVVSNDKIITCYRSKNPFKHIKMKSKKLYRNIGINSN